MTSPAEIVGTARAHLDDAQKWVRLIGERPVVSVPAKAEGEEPTEIVSRDAAAAQLRAARRLIDLALASIGEAP
jgi:hypothetical protein